MPKTLIAQGFTNANVVKIVAKDGVVTDVTADVEVNYGAVGMSETVSIFSSLTAAQKTAVQNTFDKALARVAEILL